MNYPLKSSRRAPRPHPVAILVVILGVAFIAYISIGRFANEWVLAATRPFLMTRSFIASSLGNTAFLFEDRMRLVDENTRLAASLSEAQAALQTLDAYKKENDSLKIMLGRKNAARPRVVAAILAKPPRSLYDTLILDAGANAGIVAGDYVMFGDFIIGTIREVEATESKATLFSSASENFSVIIGGNGITAQAQGQGGGNFLVKLPKGVPISVGDVVRLPGLDPKFFGTVANIEETATGTFQSIRFTLPVNINEIDYVEIAKQ